MNLAILFIIKIVDNLLGTGKTLLIQKNKEVFASLIVVLSQVLFFTVISKVISANDTLTTWIVSIGAGIGTYAAMKINKRFSRDRMYISNVLSDDKEAMVDFSNFLKDNKVKNMTTNSYTKDWGETLAIVVYADTKEKHLLVEKFIEDSDTKFLKIDN